MRCVALAGCAALAVLGAACAQAGSGAPVDGSSAKGIDASARQLDAAVIRDAASLDATAQDACLSTATCAAPTMTLPTIDGDDNGGVAEATASGYQAAWFSIRVSEEDSSVFADPMNLSVQLVSPSASAMFDLLVYMPGDASSTDCTSPSGTVQTSGTTESVSYNWGETGTFANNSDDSRTVSVQITPKQGVTCSASAMWQLTLIGG